ncbi:hypothetical protein BYT27DRAFT_7189648 [Phlegmacium glaucopus]|nr:hypothetical protein BYT27DRAFT_7189648 [Phlegmacium glaucopus]
MARTLILVQLLSCVALAFALDITGKVSWSDICPDAASLGHAKVSLDDGVFSSGVTHDGKFIIPDVLDGTYILSLISHDYSFDQLRLDVKNSTTEVRPYVPGTPLNPPSPILLAYPIVLTPREKSAYFVLPETFNLVAMMSNPMMLLMVFGGGMMLAMPYLMKNLDPEALAEFKEQQGKINGALQSGDLKTGLSALVNATEDNSPTVPSNKGGGGGSSKPRTNRKAKR